MLTYVLNLIDWEVSGQNMKHQEFLAVLICDLMTEKSYFSESAVFGTDHMMLLLKDDRSGKMVKCSKSFLEGCNQCTEAHTKHRPNYKHHFRQHILKCQSHSPHPGPSQELSWTRLTHRSEAAPEEGMKRLKHYKELSPTATLFIWKSKSTVGPFPFFFPFSSSPRLSLAHGWHTTITGQHWSQMPLSTPADSIPPWQMVALPPLFVTVTSQPYSDNIRHLACRTPILGKPSPGRQKFPRSAQL